MSTEPDPTTDGTGREKGIIVTGSYHSVTEVVSLPLSPHYFRSLTRSLVAHFVHRKEMNRKVKRRTVERRDERCRRGTPRDKEA